MMQNRVSIGHNELRSVFHEIYKRSRKWQQSPNNWIHKKLLEACMCYTKNGFRITNATVLARISVAFKELRIKNRRINILLDGEIKALEMQVQYRTRGVFKWASKLETWLETESYKFWLGTIQYSLSRGTCLKFEIVGHQSDGQ
jgi:hypothetical protein